MVSSYYKVLNSVKLVKKQSQKLWYYSNFPDNFLNYALV